MIIKGPDGSTWVFSFKRSIYQASYDVNLPKKAFILTEKYLKNMDLIIYNEKSSKNSNLHLTNIPSTDS